MKFKVGDEVRVSLYCERYEQDRIYGKAGYIIKIDERLMCPIAVKFEGIFNNKAMSGYFYFNKNELRPIHKTDNVDIIWFNKLLQEITYKYGLIGSYRWSDDLNGYLYDFYRGNFTNSNRVARILVKPNQIDEIDETLSNIDEHLAERLYKKDALKMAINSVYGLPDYYKKELEAFDYFVTREKESNMLKDKIEKVIFNDPATIVFWKDGTKTVVKASNKEFDPEKGLAMAIAKKALGNEGNYYNEFKKWLPKEETMIFEEKKFY